MRDFTEQQRRLVLVVATFLVNYRPSDLQRLVDEDVEDAARALAATLETSNRGVIYEHPATSATGSQLVAALKPVWPRREPACRRRSGTVPWSCVGSRKAAGRSALASPETVCFWSWLGCVMRPDGTAPAKADPLRA